MKRFVFGMTTLGIALFMMQTVSRAGDRMVAADPNMQQAAPITQTGAGMTMEDRVYHALHTLRQNQLSDRPILAERFERADGIAICWVDQGALAFGGMGGEGIVILHDKSHIYGHEWRAPIAINIAGGSFGAQIGFTCTNFIVLLNNQEAVEKFTTEGHVNWEATATGTYGTQTARESDTQLDLGNRAIVVYRASGGLFGGAYFGANSIYSKDSIDQAAYGPVSLRDIIDGRGVEIPGYMRPLYRMLKGWSPSLEWE